MFEQKIVAQRRRAGRQEPDPVGRVREGRRGPARRLDRDAVALPRREKVGESRIKTQPGKFMLAGEGLCVGRDSGEAGHRRLPGPHPHEFTGGTINRVAVDVSGEPYIDLEREAAAMLARE